jgi:hypothetical protein
VTKKKAATAWLEQVLKSGPQPAIDIIAMAQNEGSSLKILQTVKAKLRVRSIRKGQDNWVWALIGAEAEEDQKM